MNSISNASSTSPSLRAMILVLTLTIFHSSFVITPGQSKEPDDKQGEKLEAVLKGLRSNIVEGKVVIQREGASFDLLADTELKDGDVLVSEADGRVEILLQPGNYLRMTGNTKLQIVSTQYDKIRIHLETGGVACELLKQEKPRFFEPFSYYLIRLTTARSEAMLTESGVYRFNVTNDSAELWVRKGDAEINGQRIKEKRIGRELVGVISVAEFDPRVEDKFDAWCRDRGNQLTQANRQLKKEAPWAKKDKEGETIVDVPSDDGAMGDSPYVVSAKPGKVTYVDAGVEVSRSQEWEGVTVDTKLESKDKLRTAPYSRIELMMFPDIFLRIDGNSEVIFEELTNDALTIRIMKGSAILEAGDFNRKRLPEFKIGSTSALAVVLSNGNYRWDVTANSAQVDPRDGRVALAGRSTDGCRRFSGVTEAGCEKKRNDNFDSWSDFRGEGVTGNGRSLTNRYARVRNRWLRDTGFWYRSQAVAYYTFVPYHSTNFDSPYGGSYSVALAPRRSPMMGPPDLRRSFPRLERTIVNPNQNPNP